MRTSLVPLVAALLVIPAAEGQTPTNEFCAPLQHVLDAGQGNFDTLIAGVSSYSRIEPSHFVLPGATTCYVERMTAEVLPQEADVAATNAGYECDWANRDGPQLSELYQRLTTAVPACFPSFERKVHERGADLQMVEFIMPARLLPGGETRSITVIHSPPESVTVRVRRSVRFYRSPEATPR